MLIRTSVRGSVQKSKKRSAREIKGGWSPGLLFGANANNGVNAGVRYSNANNVPANANTNISAQLSA